MIVIRDAFYVHKLQLCHKHDLTYPLTTLQQQTKLCLEHHTLHVIAIFQVSILSLEKYGKRSLHKRRKLYTFAIIGLLSRLNISRTCGSLLMKKCLAHLHFKGDYIFQVSIQ